MLRRKLVNAGFTRKQVKDKTRSIAALCDTLIDAVCERGHCDFVRDLAAPLPMAVIGDMLGWRPRTAPPLCLVGRSGGGAEFNGPEETLAASVAAPLAYNEFMAATIERRRGEPTDDLVSVLIAAEVDGERLTDEQITSETLLILIGGDETTRHTSPGVPPN